MLASAETVETWRLPTASRPGRLPQLHGVTSVALSPDNTLAAVGRSDGRMAVYRLDTGERVLHTKPKSNVCKDVAWLDNTRVVGIYPPSLGLQTVDVTTAEPVAIGEQRNNNKSGRRLLALAGDRTVVLTYGDGGAVVFDADGTRDNRYRLPGVEFWEGETTEDGRHGVLLARDGRVAHIQAPPTPRLQLLWSTDAAGAVDITTDGSQVIVGESSPPRIELRDTKSGDVLRSLPLGDQRPTEVAVSADGAWIAAGDVTGAIWVFSPDRDRPVAIMAGHTHLVSTLAFTSDGHTLVSGSWDGDLRFWDLSALDAQPADLVAQAHATWGPFDPR